MARMRFHLLFLPLPLSLLACGGNTHANPDAGAPIEDSAAPLDAGLDALPDTSMPMEAASTRDASAPAILLY